MLKSVLASTRFWGLVASLLVTLLKDKLPLTEDQITQIVLAIGAWVAGESLRATSTPGTTFPQKLLELTKSKRFWATLSSIATVLFADKFGLSAADIDKIILVIATFVGGESLRQSDAIKAKRKNS